MLFEGTLFWSLRVGLPCPALSGSMFEFARGRMSARPRGEWDAAPEGVEGWYFWAGVPEAYLGCSGVLEKGMYFWSGPRPAGLEREYECDAWGECCDWLMVFERVGSVYCWALVVICVWVGATGAV